VERSHQIAAARNVIGYAFTKELADSLSLSTPSKEFGSSFRVRRHLSISVGIDKRVSLVGQGIKECLHGRAGVGRVSDEREENLSREREKILNEGEDSVLSLIESRFDGGTEGGEATLPGLYLIRAPVRGGGESVKRKGRLGNGNQKGNGLGRNVIGE
jgi:hypothetical protein